MPPRKPRWQRERLRLVSIQTPFDRESCCRPTKERPWNLLRRCSSDLKWNKIHQRINNNKWESFSVTHGLLEVYRHLCLCWWKHKVVFESCYMCASWLTNDCAARKMVFLFFFLEMLDVWTHCTINDFTDAEQVPLHLVLLFEIIVLRCFGILH